MSANQKLDVISIGHASYDLVFSVPHHPKEDEKLFADNLLSCGGGPAANASVIVARLGFKSAFAGYLGNDVYGDSHLSELHNDGVDTRRIVRGNSPTPLSAVLVKPDGKRALLNYKGNTKALSADCIDFAGLHSKVVLFDGHEPHISLTALNSLEFNSSLLDAGSLHDGTRTLMDKVDYLVCSEKFALQYAADENMALSRLATLAPFVVITLGERGLIWQRGQEHGHMKAPTIIPVDTTGAGDAFHGAFAAGLAADLDWQDLLRYASAAGAICCKHMGARPGLADARQLKEMLANWHDY